MEIRYVTLVLVMLIFNSCELNKEGDHDLTDEIKHEMQQYRQAWRTGDSTLILKRISPDIILFQPGKTGKPILGKKELSKFWFPESDISYPIIKYEIENEEIGRANKLAYYQGLSKLTWCTSENGVMKDTTHSVSEFTNILRNEDGNWKIYRIMYNLKDKNYSR